MPAALETSARERGIAIGRFELPNRGERTLTYESSACRTESRFPPLPGPHSVTSTRLRSIWSVPKRTNAMQCGQLTEGVPAIVTRRLGFS